jgi:hypothetical protein
MIRTVTLSAVAILALVFGSAAGVDAALLGPTAYSSSADSICAGGGLTFCHLETFEDHALNTPGVSANVGGVTSSFGFTGTIIDSVLGDGPCPSASAPNPCDSYFGSGPTGFVFTFNAGVLGSLPNIAGIVWTDGTNNITFEAFDENGDSLGTVSGSHADGTFQGTTDDDRFYGVTHEGGISAIKISSGGGGIEVDHLQYGLRGEVEDDGSDDGPIDVPAPGALLLLGSGLMATGAVGFARRKR